MKLVILLFCFVAHAHIVYAQSNYDSTLMTPDVASDGIHGYNLTKLGSLVYLPWELTGVRESSPNSSEDIFLIQGQLDSVMANLVIELQKNGSIKFWFKQDYLVQPIDTIPLSGGGITITKHQWHSDEIKVRKIFMNGNWKINSTGDSIKIQLGKSYYNPISFEGRLAMIDAANMCIVGVVSGMVSTDSKKKKHNIMKACFQH